MVMTSAAGFLLAACERNDGPRAFDPLVAFDTGVVRIETATDTVELTVEIAETAQQRSYGLMERPSLAADAGMIFLYAAEQDAAAGFWMYRTLIPLDIAFLDADGRVVALRVMEPCPYADARGCPTYPPGVQYWAALEVNRGYFSQRGIGIGDRAVLTREGVVTFPAAHAANAGSRCRIPCG